MNKLDKNKYMEILNMMAFEIHESYLIRVVTDKLASMWNAEFSKLNMDSNNKIERLDIAKMGPVTTILGDTFHYYIVDRDIIIKINGIIINNDGE